MFACHFTFNYNCTINLLYSYSLYYLQKCILHI